MAMTVQIFLWEGLGFDASGMEPKGADLIGYGFSHGCENFEKEIYRNAIPTYVTTVEARSTERCSEDLPSILPTLMLMKSHR